MTDFDVRQEFVACYHEMKTILSEVAEKGSFKEKLLARAELRRLLSLADRMNQNAASAQATLEFQRDVLEALERSGVKIQRRIIGMFEKRADQN